MTATSSETALRDRRPSATVVTHPVTFGRAVSAEWIKFRTLRSTWAVLATAVVGMIVIGLIVAYNTRHLGPTLDPEDVLPSATLQGYYLGQLLIGALGVLFVSGEYSTGMIRSTLAAVPRRLPVAWAKLTVFVAVCLVAMVATSVVAFVAAQALLSNYRSGYSLSDPTMLRLVLGTGIYLTLMGVLAAGVAWIVRSTPGSLITYFAIALVLPGIFGNVLGSWGKDVAQFLPSEAGASFISSLHESPSLAPWPGLVVLVVWAVAAMAAGAVCLRRRDA
jgi:ABC-type transport system involved in multi-copper enzyme maturation permease subunit